MYEQRLDSSMHFAARNQGKPGNRSIQGVPGHRNSRGAAPARAQSAAVSVEHYENFPVASWLCPPRLRPAVRAIYWFARTADDIADEGDAPAAERQATLLAYRADLACAAAHEQGSGRWAGVFDPLADVIAA